MSRRKEIIVGVDMGGTSLRALVVNAENKILAVEKTPTKQDQDAESLIGDIAAEVEDALEAAGVKRSELCAVSVGAPGGGGPGQGLGLRSA